MRTLLTLAAITAVFCTYEGLTYNKLLQLTPKNSAGIKATHSQVTNIDVVAGLILCSVCKRHFKFLFDGYWDRHFEVQFTGHNCVATARIRTKCTTRKKDDVPDTILPSIFF